MAEITVTELNRGYDNEAATEDDGSNLRPDLVISVQPRQNDYARAELPVSTMDWQSTPRGQFIPVQGLDFLIGVTTLQIQQTVELDDRTPFSYPNTGSLTPAHTAMARVHSRPRLSCNCRGTLRGMRPRRNPLLVPQHRLPHASTQQWHASTLAHGSRVTAAAPAAPCVACARDVISRIHSENRYIVRVPNGESLYLASEVSSQTQRCLCGSGRAFVLHLHDNTRQEAMQLQRRLAASSCCFPCRLQEIQVITPPGDYIGRVQQQCTWLVPFFKVRDANDQVLFTVEGPAVMKRSALMLSEFKIMTGDSLREVGKIAHGWDRDLVSFTTTLSIPHNAVQPRHKALLLAASFLMEYTYFETKKSSCFRCNCF